MKIFGTELNPRIIRASRTPEALEARYARWVGRLAEEGSVWAQREQGNFTPTPEAVITITPPAEQAVPRYNRWRRVGAAAAALLVITTASLAPSRKSEGQGAVWHQPAAAAPPYERQLFDNTPPEQQPKLSERPPRTECVPNGESMWAMAVERVHDGIGKRAIGRVSMTTLVHNFAIAETPNIVDPDVISREDCTVMPTVAVVRRMHYVWTHPKTDPGLAANMQAITRMPDLDTMQQSTQLQLLRSGIVASR